MTDGIHIRINNTIHERCFSDCDNNWILQHLDFTMFTDLMSLSVFLGSWKFFYWIFDIKWTTAVSSSQVNGHLVVCKKMPLPGNLCS